MIHEIFGLFFALVMGFTLGTIGGGGAILTIPIFVYLYGVRVVDATQYSLLVVGVTALFGSLENWRRGLIDSRRAWSFAVQSCAGVFVVRYLLLPRLPARIPLPGGREISLDHVVLVVLIGLMVIAARAMLKRSPDATSTIERAPPQDRPAYAALQGFGVGAFTGLVGAGGGFLIVPALVNFMGTPIRTAIATSLLIIAINSLFGFMVGLPHHPDLRWGLLATFSAIALVGMFVGSRVSARIAPERLKRAFGYFILMMGTVMVVLQLTRPDR